jgi:hypothetical protein
LIATFGVDKMKEADDAAPLVAMLDRLLSMAERETRGALACARALRLTPQAQIHPRTAGRQVNNSPDGRKPWEENLG